MRAFLGVGIILLVMACGLTPPIFGERWWFLVIGAAVIANTISVRGEGKK